MEFAYALPSMTPLATEPPAASAAALAGLEPLRSVRSRWPTLIGAGLTIAMLAGLAHALLGRGLAGLHAATPDDPRFFLFFALFWATLPLCDFLIFRRLWRIPPSGLMALVRKRVANDVLINYSGEALFYAWARARATMVAAPFGAIKDVSILSAIAGNAFTLTMLAVALPFGRQLLTPEQFRGGLWLTAVLLVTSLPFLIFSRRVFSLERAALWEVFAIHCGRVVASAVFTAIAWHYALPGAPLAIWLLMFAGKQLSSRLPFMSTNQKDLAFVTVANLVVGGHDAIKQLLSFWTALSILVSVVLVVGFGLYSLVSKGRPW